MPRASRARYAARRDSSRTSGSAARTARRSTMSKRTSGSSCRGRSPAGQAAIGLYKLQKLADQLRARTLASAHVKVFVEKADDGLLDVVRREAAQAIAAPSLTSTCRTSTSRRRSTLSPTTSRFLQRSTSSGRSCGRRSSRRRRNGRRSPSRRGSASRPSCARRSSSEARAELVKAGADEKATTVTVLSAYKQGYSWLYDVVRPALAGKPVDRITIRFAEIGPPPGGSSRGCTRRPAGCSRSIRSTRSSPRVEGRHQEHPIRDDADRIAGLRSGRHGPRRRRAAAADLRAGSSSSGRSSIASRTTRACASRPAGSRPTSPAAPRSTSALRPIPNGSGIGSSRRRCRRSTTT